MFAGYVQAEATRSRTCRRQGAGEPGARCRPACGSGGVLAYRCGIPNVFQSLTLATKGHEQHFTRGNWLAGRVVDSSEDYRAKAIELLLRADRACDDDARTELINIAVSYARLVEHAERVRSRLARLVLGARSATQ
jgi:hypothetical protein